MMTCSGYITATSRTKSHSPPRSSMLATCARAIARMRSSSLRTLWFVNHCCVSERYFG